MTDHEHDEDHLLYGYVDYLDGEPPKVVILNRDDANEIVAALEAATNSNTWGEYRKNCPKVFLDRDMEDYLEYEDELPKDDDPFSHPHHSMEDYEWPKFADGLYGEGLPEEIVEEYGQLYGTVIDGTFIHFKPEDVDKIVQELETMGYTMERDDRTASNAVGYGDLRLG